MDQNHNDNHIEYVTGASKKGGNIGLSIAGFVMSLISFSESFGLMLYPYFIEIEKEFLINSYSGRGNVIFDTRFADLIIGVISIAVYIMIAVALCLSVAGIISSATNKGKKTGVIFGVIGLIIVGAAILIAVIAGNPIL